MLKPSGGGRLFIISAPSGCGKTTLCKKLLADSLGLVPSVSVTTRPPRPGEKEGVDYIFVSKKKFEDEIARNGFLEYEENFGYLYGTPKKHIEDLLKRGRPALLSVDVKGAMNIRRVYPRESVLVFILPPSIKVLEKRLKMRMSEAGRAISTRLNLAKKEISYKDRYDYRVVNDRLDRAYSRLKKIIVSELRSGG